METFTIPSKEEKLKAIEFLKHCDLKSVSEEILLEKVQLLFTGYQITTDLVFDDDLILYRGIKYSDKPSYLNQLIYPPKNIAKINRASSDGEQMFYCSSLKKAAFYELFVKIGDKLVISTWIQNKPLLFNNVGYTKSNLKSLGSSRDIPNDTSNQEDNDYIENFLSNAFCKKISPDDKDGYKLTIAIAKKHLREAKLINHDKSPIFRSDSTKTLHNDPKKFPGLQYPTIQNSGEGDNYAIIKEAFDDDILIIDKTEFVEVIDIVDNKYKYKIIDVAFEISDSKIMWKNLDKQWYLYDDSEDINFVEDNGAFEAYTFDGEKLEPV